MNSEKYWEQRAEEAALLNCIKTESYIKSLEKHYKKVLKVLEKELQDIYKKYSDTEGKLDLVALKQYINIENGLSKEKITRIEYLKRQVLNEIKKLHNAEAETLKELLKELYHDNYYSSIYQLEKNVGVHTAFDKLDTKAIEFVISQPWSGKSYSKRLWKHQTRLQNSLKDILPTGITLGESNDEMARRLKNAMDTKLKYAKRLIRTETNYVSNQATLKSYEELGIDKYKYLAVLDMRTSKICGSLDGKVFEVKKAQVAVNYPPMHPHCRSTTVPVVEETFTNQRLAKDFEGNYYKVPKNMVYKEWYEKFVEGNENEKIARVKIKNKSADKLQHEKYRETLGKSIPRSFDKFQEMKYNDNKIWKSTKSIYKKQVLRSKKLDSELAVTDTLDPSRQEKEIRKDIGSAKLSLKIHEGKQGKHIKGHNNYVQGKSYFTIQLKEMQELVNKYANTGSLEFSDTGKWKNQEMVSTNKIIGVCISIVDGLEYKTKSFKIHYSKSGTHIVPTLEKNKEVNR